MNSKDYRYQLESRKLTKKVMQQTSGISYSMWEELEAYPPNTDLVDLVLGGENVTIPPQSRTYFELSLHQKPPKTASKRRPKQTSGFPRVNPRFQ